jgi:hypothetical protein
VVKGGTDVFYFVEEEKVNSTIQMLDVNMIGLGAYSKGLESGELIGNSNFHA